MNRSASFVLPCSALLLVVSCGKTITDGADAPPCAAEGCTATDPTSPTSPTDTTGDQSTTPTDGDGGAPATRSCGASECVDGDGFCDVGFCNPCVRDDDCADGPPAPPADDTNDPADPGSDEPVVPGDLPECLEDECVDGDGFCDVELCSTCPIDADCSSTDPNDPNDPNPADPGAGPTDCQGDEDCACLPNECVAGDGFCDEDWCDCADDPDCNDVANERCIDDEDCCLPNECVAGDGFCDEDFCEGCEVDPDC